jgi:hypothetical protein
MAKTTIFKLDPSKLSDKDFYDLYDNLFKTPVDKRSGDQRINRSKINSIELKLTRDEVLEEEDGNPRYNLYLLALDKANKIRVVQGIAIDLSEEGFTTLKTLVEIMNTQSPSLNIETFHDFSVKDIMNTIYLSNYGNEQILTPKEVRSAFVAFASFLEVDNISEIIAEPTPSKKNLKLLEKHLKNRGFSSFELDSSIGNYLISSKKLEADPLDYTPMQKCEPTLKEREYMDYLKALLQGGAQLALKPDYNAIKDVIEQTNNSRLFDRIFAKNGDKDLSLEF